MGHTTAPPIRAAHLSLWHGTDPAVVAAYVADSIAAGQLDLVTLTESRGMAKAIRARLGKGWQVDNHHEHTIIWRRATFARWPGTSARQRIAWSVPWFTRGGGARLFRVLFTNLRHKATGRRVRVSVCHTPSGVQHRDTWRGNTARTRQSQGGFHRWGKWLRAGAHDHPGVLQVAAMDANLDQHLAVWRDYLTRELGLPSIWQDTRPLRGTQGPRLIDTAHTNALVQSAGLSPVSPPAPIDHRGVCYTLQV